MSFITFRQAISRAFDFNRDALKVISGFDEMHSGRTTATPVGTPIALYATPTAFKVLDIQALETNSGYIVVGGSTCVATPTTSREGVVLIPLASVRYEGGDLSKIFIDGWVDGDVVTWTYTD